MFFSLYIAFQLERPKERLGKKAKDEGKEMRREKS